MSESDVTTDDIERAWMAEVADCTDAGYDKIRHRERMDQWDRWLAAHDREVKAEAWDDGFTSGIAFQAGNDAAMWNPYWIESQETP